MQSSEFLRMCDGEGFMTAAGNEEASGTPGWFVCVPWLKDAKGGPLTCHCSTEGVERGDWPLLRKGIFQGRWVDGRTRIVGYFSRVNNWNPSKIGELKDRHKGTYAVRAAP